LVLVLVALVVDVSVFNARQDTFDRLQKRLEPARLELRALLIALVDQETGERGFLLTGDDDFLEPYLTGRERSAQSVAHLEELLEDPDHRAALERIESRISAWQELGADFEIAARRQGREEVVETLVAGGTGMRLFNAIRDEVTDLQNELAVATSAESDDLEQLDDLLLAVDFAMLLVSLVLLVAAAMLARTWFTRPLEALTRSVQEVAGGSLQSTVIVDGPPEFSELAADVDAMRRRILAEVEEAERAREALADRGMVVLTLREELAATVADLPAGVTVAGRFAPAQGVVAGDWYDVVRLRGNRVAVALVDVSGHGAGVGAFALRTKTLTLAALESHEPGEALQWVAAHLGDTGEQFLTGIIFVLDPEDGVVRYASAGHPPLLLGGLTGIAELGPTGPLLGPLGGTWTTESAELPRGGVLVAFSDGLVEARNVDGEPFGIAQLVSVVEDHQLGGPDAVADACLAAVQQHQAGREDDLTLVVVAR
jgi:sigma-B regulation protein RsbU (phosphoserine phosphatase)